MRNLPTFACQKLRTVIIFILLFCQANYSQKISSNEIATPILENCWTYPLTNSTDIGLASDNDKYLFIPLNLGRLLSIDPATGKKHWETELGGNIVTVPLINGGNVYIAAKYNGEQSSERGDNNIKDENRSNSTVILRALDKSTGVTKWQLELEPVEKLYLFGFESNIISVGENGQMSSVNKVTGKIVWKKRPELNLSAHPFVNNSEIFLGTDDNRILKLSVNDGHIIEELKISAPATVIIENADKNKLIVGDRKGNLLSINKKFYKKARAIEWRIRNGAEISSVTLTDDGLLISSFDNFIYLVSENGGKLLWKKRFTGRITTAPLVMGDYFVVNATDDSVAVVAEVKSGRAVNKITLEDDNFFTGISLRTGNLLIYSTLKGDISYSIGDGCKIS